MMVPHKCLQMFTLFQQNFHLYIVDLLCSVGHFGLTLDIESGCVGVLFRAVRGASG